MSTAQAGNGTRRRPRNQTNLAVIRGNLAEKPVLRKAGNSPDAASVTTLRIANGEIINGEQHTNFVQATLWGRAAEDAVRYLDKGREVTVTGKLRQRSYNDVNSPQAQKLGEPIRRTVVEIVVQPGGCEWGFNPNLNRQNGEQPADDQPVAAEPAADPAPEPEPEPQSDEPTAEQLAAAMALIERATTPQSAMQPQAQLQADEPSDAPASPDVPVEPAQKDIPF